MSCRHCGEDRLRVVLDLGYAPPSNAYLQPTALSGPEVYYPLKLTVCTACWLVQTEDYAAADQLFSPDYAYFSAVSQTWMEHSARFCREIASRLSLGSGSFVIEVASNDGYLLRNFVAAGIPCLGVEPTKSTADAATAIGVPTLCEFFSETLAKELAHQGRTADLIVGNNVYAHVPDINDFTAGLRTVLKPGGTITLEVPHLLQLIEQTLFDTVYHEHFSYLSATIVARIFASAGLRLYDIETLPTHGGSLRLYGCHAADARADTPAVADMLALERARGLESLEVYERFQRRAERIKDDVLSFLIHQKRSGRSVAAYGAAAKGNTLLNYAGVKPDLLHFVCDASPAKQGLFLPGSHVPILDTAVLSQRKPDFVLILPWNLTAEIMEQHSYVREWGGQFVVAVPELRVLN